jgi:protein involved in ribonucleotide reduction
MSLITYNGVIQPAVFLSFKTIKVDGARASGNVEFLYVVENELLFGLWLWARTPTGVYRLERLATPRRRLFNSALNTYVMEPIPAAVLNAIEAARVAGRLELFLTVKIRFMSFFYQLLKYLTRTDGDTFNLARPQDRAPVEASFVHRRIGERARISFPDQDPEGQREIKDIPCLLSSSIDVTPPVRPGQPPGAKLYIYMQLRERRSDEERDEAARIFMAADYSKIYRYGRLNRPRVWWKPLPPPRKHPPLEMCMKRWEKNVANYLWNHTSFTRGERIRREVMDAAVANMARPQLEVVKIVRDHIDGRLITANHWGDLREDWITEQYQRKMSDVFGNIHKNRWFASPVRFIRDLCNLDEMQMPLLGFTDSPLSLKEKAAMILQFGTGHCGEHATVSYSIIRSLMEGGHSAKFYSVVFSGNANIDHAFVIGGVRVDRYFESTRRYAFRPFTRGEKVWVIDLSQTLALADNSGKNGFVLDPYLDPSKQAPTVRELLARLKSPRRGARRTTFVGYHYDQYPDIPDMETRLRVMGV